MGRALALFGVLCAAAALVGSASPLSGITPKAFATKGDAICADYKQRVARLPRVDPSDPAAVYKGTTAVLAIARQDVARIHALPLPTTNRSLARAWVATRDRLIALLEQLRAAAKKADARAVANIAAALDANGAKGHRLARELGMKVCSVGG